MDTDTRISFYIERETKAKLQRHIGYGDIKAIYTVFTNQLIRLCEDLDPELVKAGILSESITLSQVVDFKKGE